VVNGMEQRLQRLSTENLAYYAAGEPHFKRFRDIKTDRHDHPALYLDKNLWAVGMAQDLPDPSKSGL